MSTTDFAHSTLGFSTAQHVASGQHLVQPSSVTLACFGKLPSRGDFVRSAQQPALMQQLDDWLARTMEAMSADVRWKATFDAATPLHFVFLGPHQRAGLAGYMVSSQDASGRRYPFMTTGSFDVADPAPFMAVSPLALTRLWSRLATSARLAQAASDLDDVQPQLQAGSVVVDTAPDAHLAGFEQFTSGTSVLMLEGLLGHPRLNVSVRQSLLALGLLLQPAFKQGFRDIDKALALPLPTDPAKRSVVAAFWLALISRFVAGSDVELAVFFDPRAQHPDPQPRMLVGFTGASATLLHGLLDPTLNANHVIDIARAEWVEEWVSEAAGADPRLRKLSGYLHEPQLSLMQAMRTFREAFADP